MRLYTICIFVAIFVVVQTSEKLDKKKRRAQNHGSRTAAYAAGPSAASIYTTASPPAPVYATKVNYVPQSAGYEQQQISVQQPVKLAYAQPVQSQRLASVYTAPQQQFSYSFEAQPDLRLALSQAQAQALTYNSMQLGGAEKSAPQPEVRYVAQPQQEYRYTYAQPASTPSKVTYPNQVQAVYRHQPQVQQQQVRPQYSPASSVSSFSFSSPHVSYNNHGVVSQLIGSAHEQPQPQQQYRPAPAATQYPGASLPAHGQPVQYVSAQSQYSAPQLVYVQAQKPGIKYA